MKTVHAEERHGFRSQLDQLPKPTFRSHYAHTIRFSTGTYSFKLETYYNFCNGVKECVSAVRRFDWSRENIRHTGITLVFVGLPAPT